MLGARRHAPAGGLPPAESARPALAKALTRSHERARAQSEQQIRPKPGAEADLNSARRHQRSEGYGEKDEPGVDDERTITLAVVPRILQDPDCARARTRPCDSGCNALNRFIHDVYHDEADNTGRHHPGRAKYPANRRHLVRDEGRLTSCANLRAHRGIDTCAGQGELLR